MWPFNKSAPKKSKEEIRREIVDGFADALERSWSVGALRSSRSLTHPKTLLKLVLVNRLRELGGGANYDVDWAAAMLLTDFQDMTEQEEADLRMYSALLEGALTVDDISDNAKNIQSAMSLLSNLTNRASAEREEWVAELRENGLTRHGSRY